MTSALDNSLITQIRELFREIDSRLSTMLLTSNNVEKLEPVTDWMTAAQLAQYWQLLDENKKPRTAGILKWAKRQPAEVPLPHAYMGDLLRFHRDDVDQWAKEEAERRRAKKEHNRPRTRD